MEKNKLVKVSTYAKMIEKSVETVRVWIRTGKFREGIEYEKIDDVVFINLENVDVEK